MVGVLQSAQSGSAPLVATPNFLFDQIREATALRFAEKKVQIDEVFEARAASLNAESDRFINVKAQINNANAAVENGQDSIAEIRNTLLEIRTPVALAAEPDEDIEFRATEFDLALNSINNEANRLGKAFNLVGEINRVDFSPNEIEYRSDLGIRQTTLQGTHAGADYRINVDDGTVWIPELGVDLIQQFSALQGEELTTTTVGGEEISNAASTRNAVSLVSYDPDTNAIVIDVTIDPDAAPITYTGTLERDGIGVMPAWFYDGLTTEAGRARAFEDINEAESLLTLAEGKISTAAAQVSADADRIDREFDRLAAEKTEAQLKQFDDVDKLLVEATQQQQAMLVNLDALSQQQQNYVNVFANFVTSPFTFDLLA